MPGPLRAQRVDQGAQGDPVHGGHPYPLDLDQPDAEQVHLQHARVVEQLAERFGDAADMLISAEDDILAFSGFPKEHWRQIGPTTPKNA